jgi:hypothetical protein
MSRLKYSGNKVPKKEVLKATLNWLLTIIPYSLGWVLTFPMGVLVAATSKEQTSHPQGKALTSTHSQKYVDAGSSGSWEYTNSNLKICKWWNNYEDGTLGEPSGKHSARVGGKERSFISKYSWTIRNPFNYAKRSIPIFFCPVNDCDIEYWGDFNVSDTATDGGGWHFCKATNVLTGRTYYWWRWVRVISDTKVKVAAIGFKIKPSHALSMQDKDDLDKAFTVRLPFTQNID